MRRDVWLGHGILMIAPTGRPWSVWCFWKEQWDFHGLYVNLEDAHQRDSSSIATQDHVLDLWVEPDRTVRWKDEDELAAAVVAGRYCAADADRFRRNAQSVEDIIGRWAPPFCDGWELWRPDPRWPVPELPDGVTRDFESES